MGYNIKADLLTVKEVSAFLKLSAITIYKYIKEHKIDAIQFGGHYRIEKSALVSFIKRHKIGRSEFDSNNES
jgi:excisionase family DNA binding protein